MASYRPKSLDELNNMYDKTLSAEQAIKKGTTKLANESGVSVEPIEAVNTVEIPTVPNIIKDSAADKEIEDLSFAVDNFIRHFSGEPSKPAPSPSYPRTPIRNQNQHKPNAQMIQKELNASTIPEEGDLSGLMNDYIKIMNDEDDEPLFGKRSSRHRKKDRRKNHSFVEDTPVYDEPDNQPAPAAEIQLTEPEAIQAEPEIEHPAAEIQAEEPVNDYAPSYYDYDYYEDDKPSKRASKKSKRSKKAKNIIPESEPAEIQPEETPMINESEENLEAAFERIDGEDEKDEIKVRSSTGRIVLRTILSVLFVLCFIATAAVASMNLVLNINTGKKALGDYYFFTATYDYEDAGIKTNDFVICKSSTYLIDGAKSVFVYTDTEDDQKKVAFGVKNGGMTDDDGNVEYLIGNQKVEREDALGTVEKTFPKLGKIVDIIFDYYLIFVVALAAMTIILFVLITLVLRNKEKALAKAQNKSAKKQKASKKADSEDESEIPNQNSDMETSNDFDNVSTYDDLFNDID